MPMMSEEYEQLVTRDIATYAGLTHPVKTRWPERLLRRKININDAHPNPDDEFSQPAIGPNFEIIGQYEKEMRHALEKANKPLTDRLSVEKMSVGGFMLLDGHHRWFAAHRAGITRIPVQILNVTPVSDIISKVNESARRICASFDIDEVLLTDGKTVPADRGISPLHRLFFKKRLRLNSPELIRALQALGCDVWVYTSGYIPEGRLIRLLRLHRVKVNGIVNGFRNPEDRKQLRQAFNKNYDVSLHIDGSDLVWVNTRTKEYDTVPLNTTPEDWSAKALAAVKRLDIVRAEAAHAD